MGVMATIGISSLRVIRKVKIAFFSTGDELRPVGSELAPGQIYDSNRYSIQACSAVPVLSGRISALLQMILRLSVRHFATPRPAPIW